MRSDLTTLSYKQKVRWSEFICMAVICIVVPFLMGLQIFEKFSHLLSYVLLEMMSAPVFYLFYRVYLEEILLKRKWIFSVLFFPVYLVVYELSGRFAMLLMIQFPFIPVSYRNALKLGRAGEFDHLHQNIGFTFFILFSIFSLSMVKRVFEKHQELLELRYDKVKLELENLRSQINPHFFFNTLNNLYNLSIQCSPKAPETIARLSAIMRYVIYESKDKVPLTKEIEFMQNYFELERIRHTHTGFIDFHVQGDPSMIEIEPLLFLPLIENCFKHALQKDVLENPVKIAMVIDADELIFQTSNKCIEKEKNDLHSGIGIINVRKRLQLLYRGKQEMIITQESGDYIVTIIIQR